MTRAWAIRLLAAAAAIGLSVTVATADEGATSFSTRMNGFNEVGNTGPILTDGTGNFSLTLHGTSATYTETFSGLSSGVTQSHIHFGERGVSAGVVVFLCTNLGNGPAGTPACPAGGGTVSGTISAASIIGPAGQNVTAGDFQALVRILRSGDAYVNVHTAKFPVGEIRGQVHFGDD
jgi:CHRD domain